MTGDLPNRPADVRAAEDLLDDGLDVFAATAPTYGGGLSNHGPMAAEALVHLGRAAAVPDFVESYRGRLDPLDQTAPDTRDARLRSAEGWPALLADHLADLVGGAGAQAGHGLLRTAHAVRSLERRDSPTRRRELLAALDYWASGRPLPAPTGLHGTIDVARALGDLPRLPPEQRSGGLLVVDLTAAARLPETAAAIASAAPGPDVGRTLDVLGLAACAAFLRADGLAAFALLHGVTTSTMAAVLLPHLDDDGRARLEAAMVGFVAAAVVAFDDRSVESTTPRDDGAPPPASLADAAAASLDDHDVKLTDACLTLAARTDSALPLRAAARRLGV